MLDANKLRRQWIRLTPNFTHLTADKMPLHSLSGECTWSTGSSGYCDLDGNIYRAGDSDYRFALESI